MAGMKLIQLEGDLVHFYGVDNNKFMIGFKPIGISAYETHIFEVLEDESDGYRSSMSSVELAEDPTGIFSKSPFCTVRIVESSEIDGWELVDKSNHMWLRFGTDRSDDYYPSFIFNYTPPVEGVKAIDDSKEADRRKRHPPIFTRIKGEK